MSPFIIIYTKESIFSSFSLFDLQAARKRRIYFMNL